MLCVNGARRLTAPNPEIEDELQTCKTNYYQHPTTRRDTRPGAGESFVSLFFFFFFSLYVPWSEREPENKRGNSSVWETTTMTERAGEGDVIRFVLTWEGEKARNALECVETTPSFFFFAGNGLYVASSLALVDGVGAVGGGGR
jgi:hypothetical protein